MRIKGVGPKMYRNLTDWKCCGRLLLVLSGNLNCREFLLALTCHRGWGVKKGDLHQETCTYCFPASFIDACQSELGNM